MNPSKIDFTKIQEVEHENMVLSKELIDILKNRIKELEEENQGLKAIIATRPITEQPKVIHKVATITELRTLLEAKSSVRGNS